MSIKHKFKIFINMTTRSGDHSLLSLLRQELWALENGPSDHQLILGSIVRISSVGGGLSKVLWRHFGTSADSVPLFVAPQCVVGIFPRLQTSLEFSRLSSIIRLLMDEIQLGRVVWWLMGKLRKWRHGRLGACSCF